MESETELAADGYPRVGRKPCPRCGKATHRQANQRLYDPYTKLDGSQSYELHECVKVAKS